MDQTADPIPVSLRRRFSDSLGRLVRRWHPDPPAATVAGPADVLQLPAIGPGKPIIAPGTIRAALDQHAGLATLPIIDRRCVEAGILLVCDQLEQSHVVSQALEGKGRPRTADYWHGLMHRREPDLGNAAYWFRQVSSHPAWQSLQDNLTDWLGHYGLTEFERQLATSVLTTEGQWEPAAMIALCRIGLQKPGGPEDRAARVLQFLEMLNLLDYSLAATKL